MKPLQLKTPFDKSRLKKIKTGDELLLSGNIYTLRDMSAKKLASDKKNSLPLKNCAIYFCGPTEYKGRLGSCGPTTSERMSEFFEFLLKAGVTAFIGKGPLSKNSLKLLKSHGAVYLIATGGCGAYYKKFAKNAKIVLFHELGPEAIWSIEVENIPLTVAADLEGRGLFTHILDKKCCSL